MQFAFLAIIGSERVKQPHPKGIFPVILFLLFPSIDAQSLVPEKLSHWPEFHPITSSRYYSLSNVLLRGENDSKQSDEFQASCPICFVSRVLMLTKSLVPGESSLLSQENLNCASSFSFKTVLECH